MKKFAVLFPAVLLGLATLAGAYDDDPGSLTGRGWYGGQADHDKGEKKNYRPMQRYFGNGYTISYRYVPVDRSSYSSYGDGGSAMSQATSSNFRTEAFMISEQKVRDAGANSPRVYTKDPKPARTAVTSIVPQKSSAKPSVTSIPAIAPSPGAALPIPPPTDGAKP